MRGSQTRPPLRPSDGIKLFMPNYHNHVCHRHRQPKEKWGQNAAIIPAAKLRPTGTGQWDPDWLWDWHCHLPIMNAWAWCNKSGNSFRCLRWMFTWVAHCQAGIQPAASHRTSQPLMIKSISISGSVHLGRLTAVRSALKELGFYGF